MQMKNDLGCAMWICDIERRSYKQLCLKPNTAVLVRFWYFTHGIRDCYSDETNRYRVDTNVAGHKLRGYVRLYTVRFE